VAIAVTIAVTLTACSSGGGSEVAEVAVPRPDPGTIAWSECGEGLECGTLAVPLDHAAPAGAQMQLALTRHLARTDDERIGSLLVNPGGPGVSGLFLAEIAESFYGDDLLDRFDIVAFDPRGVGKSTPTIDCIDDYDPYFSLDPTPDTDTEREALADASQAFADACAEKVGTDVLAHTNTVDAARDLDRSRRALGEAGFSYGSELGAVWATLFPDTVRAAVLDSAETPNDNSDQKSVDDAIAMERAFQEFLDECGADEGCAFYSDGAPAAGYTELMQALEEAPLTADPTRPPVNEAIAGIAVLSSLYGADRRDNLASALAAARDGNGRELLRHYDQYLTRDGVGGYTDEFEALLAYNCIDGPGPLTREGVDELVLQVGQAAPLLGQLQTLPYVCLDWPVRLAESVTITGAGAGPILVMGASGDPITSIESSRKMADTLEGGVLVTVEADQHIAYGVGECGDDAVERYLIDLVVPQDGTVCG
jgi:pimeloyl-ACP methyl ester carboxylesterase